MLILSDETKRVHTFMGINFNLNQDLAVGYRSNSQKIRVMSESWVAYNIFCPICGNAHISNLPNNMPVSDFKCDVCGAIYELKSKKGRIGNKIVAGAYATMMERITSENSPDLFLMEYSDDLQVLNLVLVPRYFFVPAIIEKRKPLSETAHRAGWTGCNILYSEIPEQGKITIIKDQILADQQLVMEKYAKAKELKTGSLESRGWLLDVLSCVNAIPTTDFSLQEMYQYKDILQAKHKDNHNIEAKIRQKLQILRKKGFIQFLGRGQYRKI